MAAAEQMPTPNSGLSGHLLGGRRVGVAGPSGCVGRLLLPELLAAGAEVVALARRPETLSGVPRIERVRTTLASDTSLRRGLEGAEGRRRGDRRDPRRAGRRRPAVASAARGRRRGRGAPDDRPPLPGRRRP